MRYLTLKKFICNPFNFITSEFGSIKIYNVKSYLSNRSKNKKDLLAKQKPIPPSL